MAEQWSIMRLSNELQTEADAYLLMERLRASGWQACDADPSEC